MERLTHVSLFSGCLLYTSTDLLTAGVLANLRQVTEYAAKHESRFVKLPITLYFRNGLSIAKYTL